jgi:WD40 repeat protein
MNNTQHDKRAFFPKLAVRCFSIFSVLSVSCTPPVMSLDSTPSIMLDRGVLNCMTTAYSLNGKLIAAAGSDNDIVLYDAETGHPIQNFVGASRWPIFSSDSKELCALAKDGGLRVWDIASRKILLDTRIKAEHPQKLMRPEFSPDNHLIAVGDEDVLQVIDVSSGKQVSQIKEGVYFGQFSFDGSKFAGLLPKSMPPDIRVWDVSTGLELAKMPVGLTELLNPAVSPNKDRNLFGKGYCTKVVEADTGKTVSVIHDKSVVLSPDGALAVEAASFVPIAPSLNTTLRNLSGDKQSSELAGLIYGRPSISGDNKRIITRDDSKVYVWDLATAKKVGELPGTPNKLWTALSHDGQRCAIVTAEKSGNITNAALFEVSTGKKILDLPIQHKTIDADDNLLGSFSPDGESIINLFTVAAADKTEVRIWKAATGAMRRQLFISHQPCSMTLSPDGKLMACSFLDATTVIYDLDSGKEIQRLKLSDEPALVSAAAPLCFSADGKILYAGWLDFVKSFDVLTGKEIKRTEFDFNPGSFAFSPNGKLLISGWALEISVSKLNGTEELTAFAPLFTTQTAAFSRDGKYLYGWGGRGRIDMRIWDAATGEQIAKNTLINGQHDNVFHSLELKFSGDLKTVLAPIDGGAAIIDVKDGRERLRLTHISPIEHIEYPIKGDSLFLCPLYGCASLFNVKTGTLSQVGLSGQEKLQTAVTADGAMIATKAWGDTTTKLLDVKSGQISMISGEQKHTESIAFSADGKTLYEGSLEKPCLSTFSVSTGKNSTFPLGGSNSEIYEIALTEDGKMLVAGNKDEVRAWNLTSKALQWEWKKDDPDIWNFAATIVLSPDSKMVAVSGTDMKIRVWNLESGKLVNTLFKSTAVIQGVATSPDSKKIAMCNDDGQVVIWSLDTGKELSTISVTEGSVNSVVFSPDGKMLIGGTSEGSAIFWSAESSKELCSVVPVNKSDYVVLDAQEGHFDASPGGAQLVHIFKDGVPLPSEEVKKLGFRPGLFLQKTGGK